MDGSILRRGACVTLFMLLRGPAILATNIPQGCDLYKTPGDGSSYFQFSNFPLPADFFGPGSDPFNGTVSLVGKPLFTAPQDALDSTNIIINRLNELVLPACGDSGQVPIEIVALNLVSINPITVTYFNGTVFENWDVNICLSDSQPQQAGTTSVKHDCGEGGTFTGEFQLFPNFTFNQVDNPMNQRNLDFGENGMLPIILETYGGYWTHSDHGFNILISPGGVSVDGNCDGSADTPVGPGSNFIGGLVGSPCYCGQEPFGYNIYPVYYQSSDLSMRIALVPPQVVTPIPTLSEWGMLAMALLLLAAGTAAIVRRRKAPAARRI